MDFKIIAVDFDGTLCESKFPKIGAANTTLINYLKNCRKHGDKIILWINVNKVDRKKRRIIRT